MRIKKLFNAAKQQGRQLFIPYITCGDPELTITKSIVQQLAKIGADVIELGVPFNDPIADGATNQKAAERALKNTITLKDCCLLVKQLRDNQCHVPIVLYTYFNPIYQFGLEKFVRLCVKCGIDAVLMVDLPLAESPEVIELFKQHQLGFISLITPTSTIERIKINASLGPEFLYYISRTGVTGESETLSANLAEKVSSIRAVTSLPLAVGFGISNQDQVRTVAKIADAVIVGSALVKKMEGSDPAINQQQLIALANEFIQSLRDNSL